MQRIKVLKLRDYAKIIERKCGNGGNAGNGYHYNLSNFIFEFTLYRVVTVTIVTSVTRNYEKINLTTILNLLNGES